MALRLVLLMIPKVTVLSRPKGLPTAMAQSPTSTASESPNGATGKGSEAATRTTARSVTGSEPTTEPSMVRPSTSPTVTLEAPSTT